MPWEFQTRPYETRNKPWKALARHREADARPRKGQTRPCEVLASWIPRVVCQFFITEAKIRVWN